LLRRVNAKLYNLAIRLLFGLKVLDIDCAFKLFRREVIQSLNLKSTGALINAELLILAKKRGYSSNRGRINQVLEEVEIKSILWEKKNETRTIDFYQRGVRRPGAAVNETGNVEDRSCLLWFPNSPFKSPSYYNSALCPFGIISLCNKHNFLAGGIIPGRSQLCLPYDKHWICAHTHLILGIVQRTYLLHQSSRSAFNLQWGFLNIKILKLRGEIIGKKYFISLQWLCGGCY